MPADCGDTTLPTVDWESSKVLPIQITHRLVFQIPTDWCDAVRKGKCHAGITRSLACLTPVWTAALKPGHRLETA